MTIILSFYFIFILPSKIKACSPRKKTRGCYLIISIRGVNEKGVNEKSRAEYVLKIVVDTF